MAPFTVNPQKLKAYYVGDPSAINSPGIRKHFAVTELEQVGVLVDWRQVQREIMRAAGINRHIMYLQRLVNGVTSLFSQPTEPQCVIISTDALRCGTKGDVPALISKAVPALNWRKGDGIVTLLLTADDETVDWVTEGVVYRSGVDLVIAQTSELVRAPERVKQSVLAFFEIRSRDQDRVRRDVTLLVIAVVGLLIVVPAIQEIIKIKLNNMLAIPLVAK